MNITFYTTRNCSNRSPNTWSVTKFCKIQSITWKVLGHERLDRHKQKRKITSSVPTWTLKYQNVRQWFDPVPASQLRQELHCCCAERMRHQLAADCLVQPRWIHHVPAVSRQWLSQRQLLQTALLTRWRHHSYDERHVLALGGHRLSRSSQTL